MLRNKSISQETEWTITIVLDLLLLVESNWPRMF